MKKCRELIAGILLLSLLFSGAPKTGLAAKADSLLETAGRFPTRYDLRDDGVVTPVKCQSPFGCCWAFAALAAAETSILSAAGVTYAQTVDKDGKGFDLSEKHLAWFSYQPITEAYDSRQAGEGLYNGDTDDPDPNACYNLGGKLTFLSSMFSSGCGPVEEEEFPYRGKNGWTDYDVLVQKGDEAVRDYFKDIYQDLAEENGETLEEYCVRRIREMDLAKGLTDYDPVELFLDWGVRSSLELRKGSSQYAGEDDWTIPQSTTGPDGSVCSNRDMYFGLTLKNGNELPELADEEYSDENVTDSNVFGRVWKGINPDGIYAVKQELMNGRGVAMAYRADVSRPNQTGEADYMNNNTWAHYTYEDLDVNHAGCIVGWDDSYSASNFNSEHRPPGDGAWLVKDSWGSETDCVKNENGVVVGKNPHGIVDENGKHTGYFWMSYYDKTVMRPTSFEFTEAYSKTSLMTAQYDYLPSYCDYFIDSDDLVRTANVFKLDDDDPDIRVSALTAKTADQNARVQFEVYKLKKGWKNPMDGTCMYRQSQNFEYSGVHTVEIAKGQQFTVKSGETVAVVITETILGDNGKRMYTTAVSAGYPKGSGGADAVGTYSVTVVNKGESFLYKDGGWSDWTEHIDKIRKDEELEVDNFSIKMLGTELQEAEQTITAKDKSISIRAKVKKNKTTKKSKNVSIAKGIKTSGNGKLTYVKTSGNKKIVVTNKGTVYAKKGIKTGTYKIQVKVKAAKTDLFRVAEKTITVTVKVKKKG